MTDQPTPLTDQQLNDIETRANAATPGPWTVELEQCDCSDGPCGHGTYVSAVYANGERRTDFVDFPDEDWQFVIRARTAVPALLAEVHRLRAERDEYCDRVDTLTAVAKGNKRHVQEMFRELQKARAALEQIRHLHKDSPMGPCPVCIDADAVAAGGDGLVPYPCPTGRLAGAQDCDPPSIRTAESETGTRQCGARHHRYPETVCTEPAGHYRRDVDSHAGPLILDGRQAGAAVWDEPAASPTT